MNKQELIEKIDNLQYSLSWNIPRINKEIVIDLIEQLDEPQKVQVPQFVADYIRYAIENDWDFQDLFKCIEDEEDEELLRWVYHERNQETLAAAWINGYTVEKEKRYLVKMKGAVSSYLNYDSVNEWWFLNKKHNGFTVRTHHTRKELEEANFGWVFDCPGIDIEEVE